MPLSFLLFDTEAEAWVVDMDTEAADATSVVADDLFEFIEKIPTFEQKFDTNTLFTRTVIP